MLHRRNATVLLALLVGCAGSPEPTSQVPTGGASTSPPEAPPSPSGDDGAAPAPSATPEATVKPAPPRAPRSAAESLPEGLSPLGDAEKKELKDSCAPFTRALEKLANALIDERPLVERVLGALEAPPAVAKVDTARCTELTRRDLLVYRARTLESEALMGLKRIAVGLVSAATREPPSRCGSAPPVPSAVAVLRKGPYTSTPAEWAAPGWRCTAFDMPTPQRFQYELRVHADGTFEAIARGFPVDGSGPEELVLSGRSDAGMEALSSDVMRR
jgi:hypothetical protein